MGDDPRRYWVRVYADYLDDPVMADALGPWDRILIAYRAVGRGRAQLPAGVPPKLAQALHKAGAIVLTGDRYTVPEIDDERAREATKKRRQRDAKASDVPRDNLSYVPRDNEDMSRGTTGQMSQRTLYARASESTVQREEEPFFEGDSAKRAVPSGDRAFDPEYAKDDDAEGWPYRQSGMWNEAVAGMQQRGRDRQPNTSDR
jgi:hypothetical protein